MIIWTTLYIFSFFHLILLCQTLQLLSLYFTCSFHSITVKGLTKSRICIYTCISSPACLSSHAYNGSWLTRLISQFFSFSPFFEFFSHLNFNLSLFLLSSSNFITLNICTASKSLYEWRAWGKKRINIFTRNESFLFEVIFNSKVKQVNVCIFNYFKERNHSLWFHRVI